MADTLGELNVRIGANIDDFEAGMAKVQEGVGRLGDALKNVGQGLTTYVSLPLALLGGAAVVASAKIDALSRGLQAVTQQQLGQQGVTGLDAMAQAAASTQKQLQDLREVAKLPGLGFTEAIQGSVRLQAVGISADQARKVLLAFGNAIATTGGGKSELDRVTVQLGQLSAKGKVLAQDLRPIIEAAPAVATALKNLYGTVDSETISASLAKQGKSSTDFIEVLTDELAKLPKVTGGLKNAFENIGDTVELNLARIGDSINKSFNLEALADEVAGAINSITDSFTSLDPSTQAVILGFLGVVAATGPVVLGIGAILAALPAAIAGFGVASAAIETAGAALLTFATGPVGIALAALAALAGGIYYVATASDRSLAAYREQAQQTDALTASVAPLLTRYEELSAKTVLTAAEQSELTNVIQQLATLVPSATTAIDAYGKATGISAAAVTEYTQALQAQKAALAAQNLPAATEKLAELAGQYDVLKKKQAEFNKTGSLNSTSFDGDVVLVENSKAGSAAVRQLQLDLANANLEFIKQKQVVEDLKGSTAALAETDASLADTLNSVGIAGASAGGLLLGLREQLKQLKEDRENADTEKETLAYNPLIKAIEKQIARLEGVDKASKAAADAVAKLRLELSRLTALDNILGNTPSQVEVLQRRADALTTGLKTLVDAGVKTSSKAFQGFVLDLVNTSQALDKIRGATADGLGLKPVSVKSLIPTTIGDTLPQDVARLLGDYAKKPIELPLKVLVRVNALTDQEDFAKSLNGALLDIGKGYQQASASAAAFGVRFDEGQAKAQALRQGLQRLIADGVNPASTQFKQLAADYKRTALLADINTAANAALASGLAQLATGLIEGLAQLALGEATLQEFGATVLALIGNLATKVGEAIIAVGVGLLAAKLAFNNPYAAIAAGAALVVVGAALGSISSNLGTIGSGGSGGSVSSPSLNYSSASTVNQAPLVVRVVGELHGRGSDLIGVIHEAEYRIQRTS